jgi:hypothetical protein
VLVCLQETLPVVEDSYLVGSRRLWLHSASWQEYVHFLDYRQGSKPVQPGDLSLLGILNQPLSSLCVLIHGSNRARVQESEAGTRPGINA